LVGKVLELAALSILSEMYSPCLFHFLPIIVYYHESYDSMSSVMFAVHVSSDPVLFTLMVSYRSDITWCLGGGHDRKVDERKSGRTYWV